MQLNDRYIKMLTGLNSGLIGYRTMSDLIASDPDAFDDLVKAGYIKKTNTILGWLVTNDARAAMRNFIDAKVLAEKTEVDKPTGFMRPCERCGGTGTVHNGPWVVCCPECDGDGIYHEPEDLSNQPEPDFNQLERDEAARLDAIEDEADLKAYRAEHGDDAPDPTPQPKPVTTFEEEWPKWEGGYEGSFCRLCKGDGCTATRQRLEITDGKVYIHVQTQCFDCGQELQGSRTEYALEELVKDHIHLSRYLATVNADLKTTRRMHKGAESNVDYWQRQFKQVETERDAARAAQNQMRDKLAAVTAERDALNLQLELLNVLPIAGQELGRYQEALEHESAQGGLEYRIFVALHRLNEIIRYAEVVLNPAE